MSNKRRTAASGRYSCHRDLRRQSSVKFSDTISCYRRVVENGCLFWRGCERRHRQVGALCCRVCCT